MTIEERKEKNLELLRKLREMGSEEYARRSGELARKIVRTGKMVAKDMLAMYHQIYHPHSGRRWKYYFCKDKEVRDYFQGFDRRSWEFEHVMDSCVEFRDNERDESCIEDGTEVFIISKENTLSIRGWSYLYSIDYRGLDMRLIRFIIDKLKEEEFFELVWHKCWIDADINKFEKARKKFMEENEAIIANIEFYGLGGWSVF